MSFLLETTKLSSMRLVVIVGALTVFAVLLIQACKGSDVSFETGSLFLAVLLGGKVWQKYYELKNGNGNTR